MCVTEDRAVADRLSAKLHAFHEGLDADERELFATLVGAADPETSGYAETVHLYFRSLARDLFSPPVGYIDIETWTLRAAGSEQATRPLP
jgi:hypothetical protein